MNFENYFNFCIDKYGFIDFYELPISDQEKLVAFALSDGVIDITDYLIDGNYSIQLNIIRSLQNKLSDRELSLNIRNYLINEVGKKINELIFEKREVFFTESKLFDGQNHCAYSAILGEQ